MRFPLTLSCSILLALTACSAEQSEEQVFQSDRPDYYVVDESLARIKSKCQDGTLNDCPVIDELMN